ncbi:MAG: hypothetical protein ACK44L_08670 [Burkholderiales bacterium]
MIQPSSSGVRAVLAVLLIGLCGLVQAQPLNARWHGRWVEESDPKNTLSITDRVFNENGQACTWSIKPVTGVKSCMAFYSGSTSKAALVNGVQAGESMIPELASRKETAREAQQLRAHIKRLRTLLQDVSNDTFRTVSTLTPDQEAGSGDCGAYYLLDKDFIYRYSTCAPAPDAVNLVRYRKSP